MDKLQDRKKPTNNPRRENRATAVQFLYMWEIRKPEVLSFELREFFSHQEKPRSFYIFAEELVSGVLKEQKVIDTTIAHYATNWNFERIAKVDLSILRLASYELLYRMDIPPIVSINEAIDLTKLFSHEEARRFVNGVLDKVKAKLDRPARSAK